MSERARPLRDLIAGSLVASALVGHAVASIRIAPDYLAFFNAFAGGPDHAYEHLVDSSLDWGQDLPALGRWLDANGLLSGQREPVYLSYFGTARPERYGIHAHYLPSFSERSTGTLPEPLWGGVYCISATMLQGVYLDARPPWTPENERSYRAAIHDLQILEGTKPYSSARAALVDQTGDAYWQRVFRTWEQLRFAKILVYLRRTRPVANVGHSILIYRLTDQEIAQALDGPSS